MFFVVFGEFPREKDKKIANRKIGVRNATATNWGADHSAHRPCDQPSFEGLERLFPAALDSPNPRKSVGLWRRGGATLDSRFRPR